MWTRICTCLNISVLWTWVRHQNIAYWITSKEPWHCSHIYTWFYSIIQAICIYIYINNASFTFIFHPVCLHMLFFSLENFFDACYCFLVTLSCASKFVVLSFFLLLQNNLDELFMLMHFLEGETVRLADSRALPFYVSKLFGLLKDFHAKFVTLFWH